MRFVPSDDQPCTNIPQNLTGSIAGTCKHPLRHSAVGLLTTFCPSANPSPLDSKSWRLWTGLGGTFPMLRHSKTNSHGNDVKGLPLLIWFPASVARPNHCFRRLRTTAYHDNHGSYACLANSYLYVRRWWLDIQTI